MELHLTHVAGPRRYARAPEPETIPEKRCRTCKKHKSLTAFAAHPLSHDGHRRDCKCCVKAGRIKKDARPSAQRTRSQRRARKKNPAIQAKNRIAVANWTRRNPQACRARKTLNNALKRGDVKKPTRCQAKGCAKHKVEGHHPDYRQPLDVLWACRSHHKRIHAGDVIPLKAGVDRRLAKIPKELAA